MGKQSLKIDDFQFTYYEYGNPNSVKLVLLHGLAGSAMYSFSELSTLLSKEYHVIAVDLPGHGETSPFHDEEQYLFSKLSDWLHHFLQKVTTDPFVVVGHSWGADITLHYAKMHPSSIKAAVLLDGGFTFPEYQEEMTFDVAYKGWEEYLSNSVHDNFESVLAEYKNYTTRPIDDLKDRVSSIFTERNDRLELIATKATVLPIVKAFFQEPFSTTYPYIKAPLLLLHATNPIELDEARRKGITELRDNVEDVTIVEVKGTGHMLQWDQPKTVMTEIQSWLGQKKLEG